MDMTIRAATPAERHYTYKQSQQIMRQTGCIGHLRGDMGRSGTGFYTSWDDHNGDLKTDAFKAEIDDVVNAMRFDPQYGGIFKDRISLAAYCYHHPESSFGNGREYGFRADTEQYSYLMRLNHNRGEYNLYVFCYRRDWLDRHLKQAEKGISFITTNYKEQFRIPDGDMIRIIHEDGIRTDRVCRYIDECHVEIGTGLYHIHEVAQRLAKNGARIIPLRSTLPDKCYNVLPLGDEIITVKKGEDGYYHTDKYGHDRAAAQSIVDEYNERLGVTKAQAMAMLAGATLGWDAPAADPKNYDEQGQSIKLRHHDRGDAR